MPEQKNRCPNCSAPMLFKPEEAAWHCPYCGGTYQTDDPAILGKTVDRAWQEREAEARHRREMERLEREAKIRPPVPVPAPAARPAQPDKPAQPVRRENAAVRVFRYIGITFSSMWLLTALLLLVMAFQERAGFGIVIFILILSAPALAILFFCLKKPRARK